MRRRLLAWFRQHARDLPWRRTREPYSVWVSEVMLQQTQVAAVVPYFERFLQAFPTLEALASADESEVLRLWEGLGYYRRARQLHQAARVLVDQHGGEFPQDPRTVQTLPGVGRYTAGAVLSIAFDAREPILEANTLRVWCRLLAYRGDPRSAAGQTLLWQAARSVLPRRGSGDFNQALMELGSKVCSPRTPACQHCPLAELCPTRVQGLQAVIPAPRKRLNYEDAAEAYVVVRRQGQVLLRRCQDQERWAGLWDFPRFALSSRRGGALQRELCEGVRRLTGVCIAPGRRLATIKHGVTRFRITLACYEAAYVKRRQRPAEIIWVRPENLGQYPLSVTGRKVGRLLAAQSH